MIIRLYGLDCRRYGIAQEIRKNPLVDSVVILQEFDHSILFEVLCPPEYASKIEKLGWNRVQTSPIFYRSDMPADKRPVTFVRMGITGYQLLEELCSCFMV